MFLGTAIFSFLTFPCSRGYAEAEIEAVFAKYDLDGDRVLSEEEQRNMNLDLEQQRKNLDGEIDEAMTRPKSGQYLKGFTFFCRVRYLAYLWVFIFEPICANCTFKEWLINV